MSKLVLENFQCDATSIRGSSNCKNKQVPRVRPYDNVTKHLLYPTNNSFKLPIAKQKADISNIHRATDRVGVA